MQYQFTKVHTLVHCITHITVATANIGVRIYEKSYTDTFVQNRMKRTRTGI